MGMAVAAVTKQVIKQKEATKKEKPRLLMASPSGCASDFFSNSMAMDNDDLESNQSDKSKSPMLIIEPLGDRELCHIQLVLELV